MAQKTDPQRRNFLSAMTVGGAWFLCGGIVLPLLNGCTEEETNPVNFTPATDDPVLDLTKETALQTIGGAVKKRIPSVNNGRTIIIVRTGDMTFTALSAQCTHEGTEVGLPSGNVIVCPNHGSRFNPSTGSVVQGPAGTSLTTFPTHYDPDKNTVTIG